MTILVTGASGQVGGALRAALDARNIPWVGLSRQPPAGAPGQWRRGDFARPESLGPALAGITTVFLASADHPRQDALELAMIAACRAHGVQRVVKLSAQSAGLAPPVSFGALHARAEQALRESGMAWTILRPVFFMQSLLFFADSVKTGKIIAATGAGEVAFVDARDVADVAATVLAQPGEDAIHTLTGPRALSFAALAGQLSTTLGRPVRHISPPRWLARAILPWLSGMPRWRSNMVIDLMAAIARGAQSLPTTDVPRILGREARTIEDFIAEQRVAFGG